MYEAESFGQWLKQRRKTLDLTQQDLAERIGCSYIAIHKIEAGERRPSRQIAELLADTFNIPHDERAAFVRYARREPHHDEGATSSTSTSTEGAGADRTPWRAVHLGRTNLPSVLTPLIGRESEEQALHDLLLDKRKGVRLVTLTGPPGIGKTRLSIEVAFDLLDQFEDGVFFVGLAPVREPDGVVRAIAGALEVTDAGGQPLRQVLLEYIRGKRMLLVLDNFEQVLDAGTEVVALLEGSPWLKVLITSRQALHVRGEHLFRVPPLQLPDLAHFDLEAILSSPAVALFIERAQAIEPDFALTEQSAEDVAAICVGLEGLPLAIELAAAHITTLTPQEIHSQLENRLQLLRGGPRDLPARQQTLRNAIDWSYALLSQGEQRLFARLGAFVGGFTLSAAQAVCNARSDLPFAVLHGLAALTDKSLLKREEVLGESRYTMLETIREYAAESLKGSQEAEETRRLHAEYHLLVAEEAALHIHSPEQATWLARLELDLDNMQAAIAWSLESDHIEMSAQIADSLHHFWLARGHTHEGLRWMEDILSRADKISIPRGLLIKLLIGAGNLAWNRSEFVRAQQWIEESLKLAREEANAKSIASSLNMLGILRYYLGDRGGAKAFYKEALLLRRELGDRDGVAATLNNLGGLAVHEGDLEEAVIGYQEAISLARELGDKWLVASGLGNFAHAIRRQGDYARAEELCNESLALFNELESSNVEATIICLADVARYRHEYAQALELYRKSLTVSQRAGYQYMMGLTVLGLACLATQVGLSEGAATLFAFLDTLIEKQDGALILPVDKPEYEAHLAAAKASIEETGWDIAWSKGRAMSMEQAVAFALHPSSFGPALREAPHSTTSVVG
jgi:predicted ATPase/transcriptional regulator with XRE-family HTH domain